MALSDEWATPSWLTGSGKSEKPIFGLKHHVATRLNGSVKRLLMEMITFRMASVC